jgi:hypothetical protein
MASESVTKQNSAVRSLLTALIVFASRIAAANPGIGVVMAGEPTLQGKVRAQIGTWIQQHGYVLVAKPLSADAANTLSNCFVIEDTACARGVFEHQAHADYLVFVRVDLETKNTIALSGYWFIKDRDAVASKRECKTCANAALNASVGEMMNALFDAAALSKARVRIGTPPGLVVMLDGANVGVTPIESDVPPGKHTIALVRDGKQVGTRDVEVAAGDVTDVVVPIGAEPPPPPRHDEPEPSVGVLPKLLVFSGAGAVAVGAVYIYYGHKNGPDDPVIYPDANKDGAIIAGVGGVALVTGLVIWWVRGSASTNGPTATIGSGGTMIGWSGRF